MTPTGRPDEPSAPDAGILELLERHQEAVQSGWGGAADALTWEILAWAGRRAAEPPSAEFLLQMEADRCEAAVDWRGAEAAYRKALERALATGEEVGGLMARWKSFSDLSRLHALVGDEEEALEEARSATEAARRADMPLLLGMAAEQQAAGALRLGRVAEAVAVVDEALRALGDERLYDLQRGRCLVLRAECRLESGDGRAADADLGAAWPLLEAQSVMQLAAGAHSGLAKWWSVNARRRAERGDRDGAVQAWAEAVACRRHVAGLPQVMGPYTRNALAGALAAYGQALVETGHPEEANGPLAESRALRERIGLPPLVAKGAGLTPLCARPRPPSS